MKKILILLITVIGLVGCNNRNESDDVFTSIENKNIKISNLIKYNKTPTGISIITLPEGKRFIYSETSHGVALCQIIENGETTPFQILTDTTTSY